MPDKAKFENTVLAILKASPGLGSIQVRKALCIADALHNSLHGSGITGVRYVKEKMGPVPDWEGFAMLNDMQRSGLIEISEQPIGPYTKNSYNALSDPDRSALTESQREIINYAANLVAGYSAADLSGRTHDAVYESIGMRCEIPLDAICVPVVTGYDTAPFTEGERADLKGYLLANEDSLRAFV
jgi:hypothetical protein